MGRRTAPTTVPVVAQAPKIPSFHPEDRRLSLRKCRGLVGSSCQLTDEQLKALRDRFYVMADTLTAEYLRGQHSKGQYSEYDTAASLGRQLAGFDSVMTVM